MPKSRKVTKKDGVIHKQDVATKFKIGNRKTGTAAHLMSTAQLEAVIEDDNRKKFHNKARQVLAKRAA